ncbi:11748_t:CDS:2, partial [Funneliformis caledonium]
LIFNTAHISAIVSNVTIPNGLDSDAAILIELKFAEGSFLIVENATNAVVESLFMFEENISEISKENSKKTEPVLLKNYMERAFSTISDM